MKKMVSREEIFENEDAPLYMTEVVNLLLPYLSMDDFIELNNDLSLDLMMVDESTLRDILSDTTIPFVQDLHDRLKNISLPDDDADEHDELIQSFDVFFDSLREALGHHEAIIHTSDRSIHLNIDDPEYLVLAMYVLDADDEMIANEHQNAADKIWKAYKNTV